MKRQIWLLGIALVLAARPLTVEARPTVVARPVVSCGSQVLQKVFEMLHLMGRPRAVKALEHVRAQAGFQQGMNSLEELKAAAESSGLRTAAVKVSLEGLRQLVRQGVVIANVTGNIHFCLITDVDGRGAAIYDPGLHYATPTMPISWFMKAWDGRVLVVSSKPILLSKLSGPVAMLSRDTLKAIVGGEPCGNVSGGGGSVGGTGGTVNYNFPNNGPPQNSSPSSTAAQAPTTHEPVHLANGNLFLDVTDVSVPTRGLPLTFSRYYNAEITSEVPGWLPEPGAGSWAIENDEYSGQGNRSRSDLTAQDLTVELDMQTIQAGANTWETAWVNIRYQPSPTNPRFAYNGYYFLIHTNGTLELSGWASGSQRFLYTKLSTYSPFNKNHVKIVALGSNIQVYVNGNLEINYTDPAPVLVTGQVALESYFCHAHYDNVAITIGTTTTTYAFSNDDNEFPLGYGWTDTYSMRIREYPSHVTLIRENNAKELYVPQADGSYLPVPVNTYSTLSKDASGFTLRTKYGIRYRFDLAGRLLWIQDRNNNQTTLTYGTVGGKTVLTQVAEPAGRKLILQYGTNGLISSVTDPSGTQVTYTYDASNHLTAVQDRLGRQERYAYDPVTQNLTQLTDKEGNQFHYTYGYNDRLIFQTDPLGQQTTFDYLWDTVNVTNVRGEIYRYNFDGNRFVQSIADPALNMERFDNDTNGNPINRYDRNSNKTSMTYDANGNRTSITDPYPLNSLTTITYDPVFSLPTSTTDAKGNVTTMTYDAKGNLLQTTDALGGATTYTYNAYGQPLTITDPRSHTTAFTYDSYGNLATITDPLGNVTTYTYDVLGRRTRVADTLGTVSQTAYDANGQVLSVTNALNQTTTYTYTPNGHVATITDPLSHTTSMTYDCFGNVLTVTDAKAQVTRFAYDTANQMHLNHANRISLTDANHHTTTYSYDAMDRLIQTTDAAGRATQFTYDNQGNRLTRTNPLGQVTNYIYDTLNRLTITLYPDFTGVSFGYDAVGNIGFVATDAAGVTQLTYDALHRLIRRAFPDGTTFDYAYDAAGNRASLAISGIGAINYAYDALNRLTQITAPGGTVYTYTYDQRSRRTQLQYPNGVTTTYSYDAANELASLSAKKGISTITQASYAYDAAGRRTQYAFTTSTLTGSLNYGYDAINELLQETGIAVGQSVSTSFSYDSLGNRTQRVQGGVTTTYTYDALNALTSEIPNTTKAITVSGTVSDANLDTVSVNGLAATVTGGSFSASNVPLTPGLNTLTATFLDKAGNTATNQIQVTYQSAGQATYAYDALGNRIRKQTLAATETYGYDLDNRLISYANGTTTASYVYDGFNGRARKTINGVTTMSYQDGQEVVLETTGGQSTFYLHGPTLDELLVSTTGTTTRYYHQDGLGSVLAVTDGAGAILGSYVYEPFGSLRQSTGSFTTPWTFTGRPLDSESGLVFLRHRYYDPKTGTFLTQDPIGVKGGINLYKYVQNNPISFIDPFGLRVEIGESPISGVPDTYHTAIILIPDNGGPTMILSGHPQDGLLVATPNSSAELTPGHFQNITQVTDPYKRSDAQLIQDVITTFRQYQNNLPYFPDPAIVPGTFNSNSLTSGTLLAAGLLPPQLPGKQPGREIPVTLAGQITRPQNK